MSKVKNKVSEGLSNIDPTTSEGLTNIATGGLIGGTTGVGDKLFNRKEEKPKEADSSKAAAEVAIKEYDFARKMDGVKSEYESRIERLGTKGYRDYAKAKVGRKEIAGRGVASGNVDESLRTRGVDPSSGAAGAVRTKLSTTSGDSIGRGKGEAEFSADTAYLGGKSNRVKMALGEKTEAVIGLNDIAGISNQESISDSYSEFNSDAAMSEAAGTAAGFGLSYASKKPNGTED
jgi:hypothetical protein